MNITSGDLVMVDLNTAEPKVFWKGNLVEGVAGIVVDNDAQGQRVVLRLTENESVAEMQGSGIIVRRV